MNKLNINNKTVGKQDLHIPRIHKLSLTAYILLTEKEPFTLRNCLKQGLSE